MGGFGSNDKGPHVSDKLKLLKSNSKYKDGGSISPEKIVG
jgi:hypothetical protein